MIYQQVKELMNQQIKNELESYYIYLSMVAYFHSGSQNIPGGFAIRSGSISNSKVIELY
jgi:ferritin